MRAFGPSSRRGFSGFPSAFLVWPLRPPVRSRPSWPGLRACLPAGWRPCWAVLGRCVPRFVFSRLRSGPWVLVARGFRWVGFSGFWYPISHPPRACSSGPGPSIRLLGPSFRTPHARAPFPVPGHCCWGLRLRGGCARLRLRRVPPSPEKGVVGSKWASPWPDYTLQSVWTGQQVGVALALQSVWTSLRLKTVLRGSKWAAPWPTQH